MIGRRTTSTLAGGLMSLGSSEEDWKGCERRGEERES